MRDSAATLARVVVLIRPLSDLHLEFGSPFVPPPLERDDETALVLAGDIHNGVDAVPWIAELATRFRHVLYVVGNHEHWGDDMATPARIDAALRDVPNATLLHNRAVVIDDTRFVGGTLWTDFRRADPRVMRNFRRFMADPDRIRGCTADAVLLEHRATLDHIERTLAEPHAGPTVVVTHHGPTLDSIHRRYADALGNEYFVSDLLALIWERQPALWLHGHTHEMVDYRVGATRVRTNPYGYHGHALNHAFDPALVLEVPS